MEYAAEQIQVAKQYLVQRSSSSYAPRPVIEAMMTLAGGVEPVAAVAEGSDEQDTRQWRAVWLLETRIAYVEATKKGDPFWDLRAHQQEHDTLSGWIRPVADIARIEVRNVTVPQREFGTSWSWSASEAIVFKDGSELPMPLLREYAFSSDAAAIEDFMRKLKDRL
jgi:hypothetical protein